MQRIPEPELMDDDQQAQAYANADFAEPHEHFVTLLQQALAGSGCSGFWLDLGCGPGDITRRVARRLPNVSIHGVDGAQAMLTLGKQMTSGSEYGDRIHYIHGLLPHCRLPLDQYDGVFSNSLLHHLGDPMVLWSCIKQYAKPGAPVFIMDLMRPDSKQHARQLMQQYAAGEPQILQEDFYHSLLAAYTPDEVRKQLAACALQHFHVTPVSDRHLTISGYL